VDDAHAEQLESEPQELPPPKRRFLRRSRPASLAAPAAPPDPGFHQELPTEHHDLLEHPEPLAPEEPPEPAGSRPPLLRFEHPPKRPRFTAEPPSPEPESEEATESPDEPLGAAPIAPAPAPAAGPPPSSPPAQPAPEYEHFDEPPADDPDAETTEFDVQKHLAEPQGAPEGTDEDVLEETPEFLQDTPEHDRLWFEQRPPKDFDFNG
jgi:hypothetical protein